MKKHRKKNDNTLTGSFIKAHCGEISDHQLVALLSLNANENDLEEAMAWDMGESDFAPILHRPLSGKAEKIYEILNWDKLALEEERNS